MSRHDFSLLCLACLAALTMLACAGDPEEQASDAEDASFALGGKADSPLEPAHASGVLLVANSLDEQGLDDEVGLDSRAARNIIAHRDGADAVPGSSDDELFDSLAELDAIKWVGPNALARLLSYALANGYIDDSAATANCLIISEYIEGGGQYNKAIEIFNCGAQPVDLREFSICLVRNNDTGCSVRADLGEASLAPGSVSTLCRRKAFHPAGMDPLPQLAQACQLERAAAMSFSGDDRLLLMRADGSVADSIGRIGFRPLESTWSNLRLDRCNFTPADGVSYYDHEDYFRVGSPYSIAGYGQAPTAGCP